MVFRNWGKELTEENLREQIAQAKQAWKTAEATEPRAESVHYDRAEDLTELVAGIFGTKSWMAELGRKGGEVTSSAKSAAARQNGKKGGRPKKNLSLNS